MPYIRVKKKRQKSLARRFKGAFRNKSAAYYIYLAAAFILALYFGRYLLRYLMNGE